MNIDTFSDADRRESDRKHSLPRLRAGNGRAVGTGRLHLSFARHGGVYLPGRLGFSGATLV